MRHPAAALAAALTAVALTALGGASATASPAAPAAPAAAGPGEVCFWPEPGQMGGGAWCYRPGGYAEAGGGVHRHAGSFRSDYNGSVFAIHFPRWGGCVYREIRAWDTSDNWDWGGKLDGVDSEKRDCQPG
ncbi:hypothetical protein [Streptomyces luteocolor]|uniref:hypothetical protein n=2 Tax=Streptomyces TaxID=1883 RepID=UPI001ED9D6C7|nr:hypothetical protein [Streptomyces luteocolor]